MPITVRRADREDAPTLLKLIEALADFEKLEPPTPEAQERFLAHGWPTDDSRPHFSAWLAEAETPEETQAVGYAITFTTYSSFLARPTLYLEDIFVLPSHRRQAVGTILLNRLVQEAWETGCGRMEWVVLDWNTNAQRFYQKHGAQHLHDWQVYRLDRDGMEKLLASRE